MGQREKLACVAFSAKATADPMGSFETGVNMQHCPELERWDRAFIHWLLAELGLRRESQLSSAFFSQRGLKTKGSLLASLSASGTLSLSFLKGFPGGKSKHLSSHRLSPDETLAQINVLFLV